MSDLFLDRSGSDPAPRNCRCLFSKHIIILNLYSCHQHLFYLTFYPSVNILKKYDEEFSLAASSKCVFKTLYFIRLYIKIYCNKAISKGMPNKQELLQ